MSDMRPERVWVDVDDDYHGHGSMIGKAYSCDLGDVEYIRADVHAARIAEARDKALEDAAVAAYIWMTSTDAIVQQKRLDAAVEFFELDVDRPAEQVRDAIRNLKGAAK